MLQRLRLESYKAFEDFTLGFSNLTLLVGPNSAGKSTIIAALRSLSLMLRHAMRRTPEFSVDDRDRERFAYAVDAEQFEIQEENLRHDFREVETRLEARFSNRLFMHAVWPTTEDAYFFLARDDGWQPRRPTDVRSSFPTIEAIPVVSPVEPSEGLLDSRYVKRNLSSHLASRHFRNHLYLLSSGQFTPDATAEGFAEFCNPWLSEMEIGQPELRYGGDHAEIDLFFSEDHRLREIVWAGDGVQVWLQLLWHLYLRRRSDVLILDEPDLFLHADLQRRLLRLLGTMGGQKILATHSAEMLAEAPIGSVVWVDKSRGRAVHGTSPTTLETLSYTIGSAFNLRLARALRTRLALFVEGEDMSILRALASTVGAQRIAREDGIAVVPMEGRTRWSSLTSFRWLSDEVLQGAVSGCVILDRDYHNDEAVEQILATLRSYGLSAHVWRRKELESYLLHESAIIRVSGAPPDFVGSVLNDAASRYRDAVIAQIAATRQEDTKATGIAMKTIVEAVLKEVERLWQDEHFRLALAPPKLVLARVNEALQANGYRACSFRALSRELAADEIPQEMVDVLRWLEDLAT